MAKNKRRISSGEVFDAARETAKVEQYWVSPERSSARKPSKNYKYIDELIYLQIELIKMQEWVKRNGLKICVIFEGRDAAGKGGVIKRITDPLLLAIKWRKRSRFSCDAGSVPYFKPYYDRPEAGMGFPYRLAPLTTQSA